LEGQPYLHALKHLIGDLYAHTLGGLVMATNQSPNPKKEKLCPHLNQSVTKDMALSAKIEPNQTMDGWIQVGSSVENRMGIWEQLDPSKQRKEFSPTEGMNQLRSEWMDSDWSLQANPQ
jgi:hypothetical protein